MAQIRIKKDFATVEKVEWWKKLQYSIPDPDKILADNEYDYQIYRDLLSDPHLWSVIQQRKAQINQMGWSVDLKKGEPFYAEILEMLERLGVNDKIDSILDTILFGFNVEEIIWDIQDDKYIPIKLKQKPVEWFIFSNSNELRLRKMAGGSYIFEEGVKLPPYKFILSQHKSTYKNPYGEKLLSKVYWPVTFKKASTDNWEQLLDKHGIPYIMGVYKSNASEEDKSLLEQTLTDMLDDNVGIMSEDTEIDFKEAGKYNVGEIFSNMVEHLNTEISKAILTVTLTTELGSTGSYKAAEIHREMFEMLGLQDKKIVERVYNKLIEYYIDINYGKREEYPKIVLEKKEEIINTTVERDKILTEMGIRFNKEYFKKRYNLNENDFELVSEQ